MSTDAEKIQQYVALRAHKEKADTEFKKSMERVNQALATLEAQLLESLDAQGTQSVTAKKVGTAYVRVVTSMKTEDRNSLLQWALKNKELDALDIRPNKTIITEKLAGGEEVPGISVTQTRLIGVRKISK